MATGKSGFREDDPLLELDIESPGRYDTRYYWQFPNAKTNKFYMIYGACHRDLIVARQKSNRLTTNLQNGLCGTNENTRQYYDWCFSDGNPWFILAKITVNQFHVNDKGKTFAVTLDMTEETDATMLAGLCFSSRLPYEQPGMFRMWVKLVNERGWNGRAAFAMCHNTYYWTTRENKDIKSQKIHYSYSGATHTANYPFTVNEFKRFMVCDPVIKACNPLNSARNYHGVSATWMDRKNENIYYQRPVINVNWGKDIVTAKKVERDYKKLHFGKFIKQHEMLTVNRNESAVDPAMNIEEYLNTFQDWMKKEKIEYGQQN